MCTAAFSSRRARRTLAGDSSQRRFGLARARYRLHPRQSLCLKLRQRARSNPGVSTRYGHRKTHRPNTARLPQRIRPSSPCPTPRRRTHLRPSTNLIAPSAVCFGTPAPANYTSLKPYPPCRPMPQQKGPPQRSRFTPTENSFTDQIAVTTASWCSTRN